MSVLNLIKGDSANRDTVTAAATTFPVYSYRTANGGALSFVTLRFHLHAVPAGTATTVNPTAIFALLGQVPGLTQAQHYRSIDINILDLLALTVPPASQHNALISADANFGAISGGGTPG